MYSLKNSFEMVHLAVGHLKEIPVSNQKPNPLQFLLYKDKLLLRVIQYSTTYSVIIHL